MSPRTFALTAFVTATALAACKPTSEELTVEEEPEAIASEPVEPVSILRPDVEAETEKKDVAATESFSATVGFPEGGTQLDADALAVLEQVKSSEQFAGSAAIILRAHSDSAGSDAVNERASEARGLAVAEWLIAAGADPRRIDVIVFGEQNPVEPNALPDGAPNEAGRAANRRVEVSINEPWRTFSARDIEFDDDGASKPSDER